MDKSEDRSTNPWAEERPTISGLIEQRLSRRDFVGGTLAAAGALATGLPSALRADGVDDPRFHFAEIARNTSTTHQLAPGHEAQVLLRWGDALCALSAQGQGGMSSCQTN